VFVGVHLPKKLLLLRKLAILQGKELQQSVMEEMMSE
jgi:hypothetical protein